MEKKFNELVWRAIKNIPRGRVATYRGIALAIGKPRASRAVGNACKANPSAPHVPCHRVVKINGSIGGYVHGAKKKIWLLARESVKVKAGKVADFEKRVFKFKKFTNSKK